jgi:hypothetical protein
MDDSALWGAGQSSQRPILRQVMHDEHKLTIVYCGRNAAGA